MGVIDIDAQYLTVDAQFAANIRYRSAAFGFLDGFDNLCLCEFGLFNR
jgi:hypothetical protein